MSDLRDDEQRAIEALQRAAADTNGELSPFATARAARALDAAIDADVRTHARWTTTRVAAVAVVAAVSAGALAFQLARAPDATMARNASPASPASPAGSPASPGSPAAPSISRPELGMPSSAASAAHEVAGHDVAIADQPALAEQPATDVPHMLHAVPPAKRVRRTPVTESERLAAAGDAVGAARVLVRAHDTAGASAALALLARRHPDAVTAVDDELAGVRSTDAMRLRCQHRLLHARDRRAMEACRAFGREHPQDPAARLLSFAAGRLAEDLGNLGWAEEEYSRALLLSPFAGLSGTDALLARARVRFNAGDVDEARADLRLYLHSEPSARREADVAKLATALGL
jgi:tetratricopeptide (TPR) repeat protein